MEYYVYEKLTPFKNKATIENDTLNKHLFSVLRKKKGDFIEITDGEGNLFKCKIIYIDRNRIEIEIYNAEKVDNSTKINLTLFLSQLRNSSRFEFAIEKSVELGVNKIVPVITKNTVSKNHLSKNKLIRLKNIIKSATGQSQRCYLPEIINTIELKNIMEYAKGENNIVMYEFADFKNNFELKFNNYNINLLIGPEGGFDEDELDFLLKNQWKTYSLGNRKVRAETAAVVSVYEILNHSIIKI